MSENVAPDEEMVRVLLNHNDGTVLSVICPENLGYDFFMPIGMRGFIGRGMPCTCDFMPGERCLCWADDKKECQL